LNFPFYIARRYVFAKKSHNAINLIAAISIIGIAVGTIAFITILSVFNGFDMVVRSMFNTFYADMEIVPAQGKTFVPDTATYDNLKSLSEIESISSILEDNALIVYGNRQTIGTVRGVSENYAQTTGIDTMMVEGSFTLYAYNTPQAILGRGIKYMLNADPDFNTNLEVIVPRRTRNIYLDNRALNPKYIRPIGYFASQPEIEQRYMIVPLRFARQLFEYTNEISGLEIKLDPKVSENRSQRKIQEIMGDAFIVKNRVQQNELLYKTMKSEKWAIFFILSFILLVASFNVVGSLTMLIIEKKNDIQTLRYLGSNLKTIRRTFLIEGLIISFLGAIAGLILGTLICWMQQEFGIVKLQGAEAFIIDAYPVKVFFSDITLVLVVVSSIGYAASWYPIRFITRKYLIL
jgi:lipoprotein-releasing system permease protein